MQQSIGPKPTTATPSPELTTGTAAEAISASTKTFRALGAPLPAIWPRSQITGRWASRLVLWT